MVANFNPNWRNITAALRLAVIAAGGTPSMTVYPANWGGAIRAIDDLRAVLVSASPVAALAAHTGAADPHSQYATDSDLTAHTGAAAPHSGHATTAALTAHTAATNNPHSTTAAQVGAVPTTEKGAANGVASLDAATQVPTAQIPWATPGAIGATTASTAVLTSLRLGTGTVLLRINSVTAVLDFPSMASQTSSMLTIAVPGATVGSTVEVGLPAAPTAGIAYDAWVSAADVVTLRARNHTALPVDPASATYRVSVLGF